MEQNINIGYYFVSDKINKGEARVEYLSANRMIGYFLVRFCKLHYYNNFREIFLILLDIWFCLWMQTWYWLQYKWWSIIEAYWNLTLGHSKFNSFEQSKKIGWCIDGEILSSKSVIEENLAQIWRIMNIKTAGS